MAGVQIDMCALTNETATASRAKELKKGDISEVVYGVRKGEV